MVSAAWKSSDHVLFYLWLCLGHAWVKWMEWKHVRARWLQGRRIWEEVPRDGHCLWLATSAGHHAAPLGWEDIYSALNKHSESSLTVKVKERMNFFKKVLHSGYFLPLIRYCTMFAFSILNSVLDKMFCRWLCRWILMCVTGVFSLSLLSAFLLHRKADNLANVKMYLTLKWKGDFHISVPNEEKNIV